MLFRTLMPMVLATSALLSSLAAQEPRVPRVGPGAIDLPGVHSLGIFQFDAPRAVIGVSTTSSTTMRDTLGVLVTAVRPGSPAEKAGVEEGTRILAINGVSLKLAAGDVGDQEMAALMARRLTRQLNKLNPGDGVDLRLSVNGQVKTVKITTVAPADLYHANSARRNGERATLGMNLAVTGSQRDTLGVFVLSVQDEGPAAKAGIEEGSRIASINGVDVRARQASDDDEFVFRASNVSRLEREVARLKPGDDVDLRIFVSGQAHNVKLKAGRLSDMPRHIRSMTVVGKDDFMIPELMSRVDMPRVEADVRHALESGIAGMGRAFPRMGGQLDW